MLPAVPVDRTWRKCQASQFCTYPGRIKLGDDYVCVEHYSSSPRRFYEVLK